MFSSTQNPSILECILSDGRKAKHLTRLLKTLGYRIVLVRNREGFDVVPTWPAREAHPEMFVDA